MNTEPIKFNPKSLNIAAFPDTLGIALRKKCLEVFQNINQSISSKRLNDTRLKILYFDGYENRIFDTTCSFNSFTIMGDQIQVTHEETNGLAGSDNFITDTEFNIKDILVIQLLKA